MKTQNLGEVSIPTLPSCVSSAQTEIELKQECFASETHCCATSVEISKTRKKFAREKTFTSPFVGNKRNTYLRNRGTNCVNLSQVPAHTATYPQKTAETHNYQSSGNRLEFNLHIEARPRTLRFTAIIDAYYSIQRS